MNPVTDPLIPYRLRTVRVAILVTALTLAGLVVYAALAGGSGLANPRLYWTTVAVATAGVAFMAALPWAKLFEKPSGLRIMFAWSAMDIGLITMLVVAAGPDHGEMFFIYALTTIFFAAACYPVPAQIALSAITFFAYLAVQPLIEGAVAPATILMRFTVIGASAWMSGFLASSLSTEMGRHAQSRREADHRAELLATVVKAGRTLSLDPEQLLNRVVDSVVELGLEASSICVLNRETKTYSVSHSRNFPDEYSEGTYPISTGLPEAIRETGGTVVLDDYGDRPGAIPALRRSGYKAVVATPIWTHGRIAAVLVGATRGRIHLLPEEIEAFELLAGKASRALENARQLEAEKRAFTRLAELDHLKGDFIANISHELRTPLTVIAGMSGTLESRWDEMDPAVRIDFLSRINRNARSLNEMVATLLDFSRVESGRLGASLEPVPVKPLLEAAAVKAGRDMGDHIFTLSVTDDLVIRADRALIARVIEALLSNAVKHTPRGTHVSLSAKDVQGRVRIEVSDDGPGIPPEERSHIGDRFFRGGDVLTRDRGLGMGLAMVKEILALQGSALVVESEPGVGSTFSFELEAISFEGIDALKKATRSGS